MNLLGIDLGSNSCGSAWIDTENATIDLAVSVFPAGVDESETKRGTPQGQERRRTRLQRRSVSRRVERKRALRRLLMRSGLLPTDPTSSPELWVSCPWNLRRRALNEPLTIHEFGRVLLHLSQRRGALGVSTDSDDPQEGLVKEAIDSTNQEMKKRNAEMFGQMIADILDEERDPIPAKPGKYFQRYAVRNRRGVFRFHATRDLIRDEFQILWNRQKSFGGELALLLTDELRSVLDNPSKDQTWRHRGALFEQRLTRWDTSTLGRCNLEATELRCPLTDMYAQEFRVLESVNNIRIEERGHPSRELNRDEREKVLAALRAQKNASVATIRKALGIHKKNVKAFYSLNIERDPDREINTDWFYREIVHGVFGEDKWKCEFDESKRNSVNRAVLKFDPDRREDADRLLAGAKKWWGLDDTAATRFIAAWRDRPKLEKRVSLSRKAIQNLLPYMRGDKGPPMDVSTARREFAADAGNFATDEQRRRYALGVATLTKADRRFLNKHDEPLPPAPILANPVVRKAIHEVRRHVIAWWRKLGKLPDRIVIEYVRSATQPELVRNQMLARNRKREAIRKTLIDEFELTSASLTQQRRAVDRILLFRQQKGACPFCTATLGSERTVCIGQDVETDHIVPLSRSQDNGLNNKVLCHRACNRGKGGFTPKEWLNPSNFEALEARLRHLQDKDSHDQYFTPRDCHHKWENLHRDAPTTTEFLASQFTDTAHASRHVAQWLRDILFNGRNQNSRGVYTTKGPYTSILRNDWGLSESDLDRLWHNIADSTVGDPENQSRLARKQKNKDRMDHVHHAIDALCIAFSPDHLQDLAHHAQKQEKARADLGYWPRRDAVDPPKPWKSKEDFRLAVIEAAKRVHVRHRPIKRRLAGALHQADHYGPVVADMPTHRKELRHQIFTLRMPIFQSRDKRLKPAHIRVPDGWDALSAKLDDPSISAAAKNVVRQKLAALDDPTAGKSGIVRDRTVRDRIRKCLHQEKIDPDKFSATDIQRIAQDGKLTMPSGIPIRGVILLRTISDPVIIPRKKWDPVTDKMIVDPDPRTRRVYVGGNNHHIEIREDQKTGKWKGHVIDAYSAARRNAARLKALKSAGVPSSKKFHSLSAEERNQFAPIVADIQRRFPVVDRSDTKDGKFVMSLAEGETIHMRHPETKKLDYFVVFKIDRPPRVHFIHHWDARPSKAKKDDHGQEIPNTKREDIDIAPSALKSLGPEPGKPPCKVRVSPLGEVTVLDRD